MLDEQKNFNNFEKFKSVFGKISPQTFTKCKLGSLLESDRSRKHIVGVLSVYFGARNRAQAKILQQEICTIFDEPESLECHVGCKVVKELLSQQTAMQELRGKQ